MKCLEGKLRHCYISITQHCANDSCCGFSEIVSRVSHIDSKCDSSCHCGIPIITIGQLIERSVSSRTLWALYRVAGPLLFRATFAVTWNKQVMRIIQLSFSAPWGLLIVCVHVLEFLSMCESLCHSIFLIQNASMSSSSYHVIWIIFHNHFVCGYVAVVNISLFLVFVPHFNF